MKEYILGLAESIGFLSIYMASDLSLVPILIILSLKSCYEKPWEVPASLLTQSSITKVLFGSLLKFIVTFLTLHLAKISPILLFTFQPAYLVINFCIGAYYKRNTINELLLTGAFLYLSLTIGASFQFLGSSVLLSIVWSYMKNLETNFSLSMKKMQIKYDSFSWILAGVLGVFYKAGLIVFGAESDQLMTDDLMVQGLKCIFVAVFAFWLPSKLINRSTKEDKVQTTYIATFVFAIFGLGQPAVYLTNLIVSKTAIFLFCSQNQEQLPLQGEQKQGVIFHILSHKDSRRIFLFLIVNFLFMFVEALYGYWSNSLGLISDAIHMCFDCTALGIGLYASYISKHPSDADHPYGYTRYEILSGFINSIFLIFVGIKIFVESIERIMEIPEIQTDMLILVSVIGLLVNIIGLMSFHDLSHGENNNLKGVFLHVLADTLGSVGVIISSILIKCYDWHIADPISSLIISTLILLSVTELLGDTLKVLMEMDVSKKGKRLKGNILKIPGVENVENIHYWKVSGKFDAAMAAIKIKSGFKRNEVFKACKEVMPAMNTVQIT